MPHPDWTPESDELMTFVDDQNVLPVPRFVTLESHRSSKALIRQKIAGAMADHRPDNVSATSAKGKNNG